MPDAAHNHQQHHQQIKQFHDIITVCIVLSKNYIYHQQTPLENIAIVEAQEDQVLSVLRFHNP
jgi:hypothetical protein